MLQVKCQALFCTVNDSAHPSCISEVADPRLFRGENDGEGSRPASHFERSQEDMIDINREE